MHYSPLFITLAAAYLAKADVSLDDLPDCSTTPLENGIGATGCSITNFACICKDSMFVKTVVPQVVAACSVADQSTFIQAAEGLCKEAGVTVNIPASGGSSSAAATPQTSQVPTTSTSVSSVLASSKMPTTTVPFPTGNGSAVANTTNSTAMAFQGGAAGREMGYATIALAAALVAGTRFL